MSNGTSAVALNEGFTDVPTNDGEMECFVAYPQQGGPFPPVILYMDAPGVREELYDFVRRIAAQGYFAVIPNLYYRFGIRDPGAQMMEMLQVHTNTMIINDTSSLISWVDKQAQSKAGPMGCIGYCMSGKFALSVTGAFPERFKAALSLYGVSHVTRKEDSAHLFIPKILPDCTLYFGFAEHDPYVPDEEIVEFRRQLASGPTNPMILKKRLAYEIVAQFYTAQAAREAEALFTKRVQNKEIPAREEITITLSREGTLTEAVARAGLTGSRSEAKRLLAQGAIEINGEKVTEDIDMSKSKPGSIIKVGKRRFAST